MKQFFLVLFIGLFATLGTSQGESANTYWQLKVDFLEPIINQSFVARIDYGVRRQLFGLVGGVGGRISEFDNRQYDIYQDKIVYRIGMEYQYFLSQQKINRGFYFGGDIDLANHTIESKRTNESVENILVVTPGLWIGWLWKPFKKVDLFIDLAILHPRYSFGKKIEQVDFTTVNTPYTPENLFNFLGPWSIAWRF